MVQNKLLLFDIDGTLISGRGIPKEVAIRVIHNRFPEFKNGHEIPFSGMTDPLIVQQVLKSNGVDIQPDALIVSEILDDFIKALAQKMHKGNPPDVLPGILKLLQRCQADKNIFLGLVTGNIMQGAKIKLSAAGLQKFFPLGAFGCDDWNRNKLPVIAIKRAEEYYHTIFKPEHTWIVGDSSKDVECAIKNHLRCLAVETGKSSRSDLFGADIILKDLSNPKDISFLFS